MDLKFISIIGAALAVAIGSIGPALGEGRAVAAAMDAIARQPEAAGTHLPHAVRRPGDDRDDGDLLPGHRAAAAVRQPLCGLSMPFHWQTLALQTANFAILVWLLHRFLYKPVLRMVDARRAEIQRGYDAAAAAQDQAKAQLAAVQAERTGIAAERDAALKAAAAQAEEAARQRAARAERDADALLESARKTLAGERDPRPGGSAQRGARPGRRRGAAAARRRSRRSCAPKPGWNASSSTWPACRTQSCPPWSARSAATAPPW